MAPTNWEAHARALDLRLGGMSFQQVSDIMGVSRARAHQMVTRARQQLAFRVFKGVPRPLPDRDGNYHKSPT